MGCISLTAFHLFSEVGLKVKEHCACDIAVKLLSHASVHICGFLFFGVVFISCSAVSPLTLIVFCICTSVVGTKLRNKTGCVHADWVALV